MEKFRGENLLLESLLTIWLGIVVEKGCTSLLTWVALVNYFYEIK